MSAKLILNKRKREEEKVASAPVDLSIPAAHPAVQYCKRECLDYAAAVLPSPTPSPSQTPPLSPPLTPTNKHCQEPEAMNEPPTQKAPFSAGSRILMEALQKIVELQQELDAFEHELDENDEVQLGDETSFYLDDEEEELLARKRHEAEALGFAMCARETLLFLQQEGVAEDSLLYRALRSKLVRQTNGEVPI